MALLSNRWVLIALAVVVLWFLYGKFIATRS